MHEGWRRGVKLPTPLFQIELGGNPVLASQTNNVYLIAAGEGALIDAGYLTASNRAALQELYDHYPFGHLFLTHGHRDHAEAAAYCAAHFDCLVHVHPLETLTGPPVPPERYATDLVDGGRFAFGEIELVVLHTPGHTPGHCAFALEPLDVVLAGDLVLGEGTTWVGPPDRRMSDYFRSLQRLLDAPPKLIASAHGPLIESPKAKVAELLAHRRMREGQVLASLEAGAGEVGAIVARIYPELEAARIPMAHLTVVGHLEKLLEEGRALRDGRRYRLP